MSLKLSALPLSALSLLALCCSPLAQAGGLMLYEVGSDNTGLVNAGAAARAQGPSTIASNPAGLSYLPGTQITAGAQVLYGDVSFDTDSSTTSTGGNGGNALGPMPSGSLFISHQLDEQWSIGFGSYGDFGLAENYDNDWAGRYYVQNASIAGLSLVPSAAYKFNDEWSLGVGLKAMYGMLQTEAAIDRAPFGLLDRADGQYKYADNTWGYGANLGVIYAPQPGTRIGLAYTSKVDLDFEDRLDVKGSGPLMDRLDDLNTKIDMSVPQTATLSLYQQLDPQWALLASVNWQDWSDFGEISVEVDTSLLGAQSSTVDANYKDTYQLALGAQYQATPKLLWNAGVAYDSSAVSDSHRTVTVPMGETWRLGTGATYAVDQNTDLNLSWDLVWMGDLPVEQSKTVSGERLSGQYNNVWIQSITGNMTWRF
ncbi:MAG: outer membrane protein transport protein [Pseudomonas sp.]|uniref:OmpP1/FadL family transporter n=1 Tax=Pseudomonas sp. TaxID=306 RepID=UPI003BB56C19